MTVSKKKVDDAGGKMTFSKKKVDDAGEKVTVSKKKMDDSGKKMTLSKKKMDDSGKKMTLSKKKMDDSGIEIYAEKKVKEAIKALKLLNEKFKGEMKKQPLFDDLESSPIYLQLNLKKIPPKNMMRIIRVPLPYSLNTETSEVCLITGDLDKRDHKAEVEPTVLHYKDLLRKHGITKVSQVIPLRQLRTEYKTFESRRQLAAAYDVFLVDKKIAGVMGKTLGKSFFQSRKFPIQIDMKRPNLKDQIDKALCQTEFSLTCRGNSYAFEVARLSMEDNTIIKSIETAIEVLAKKIPGKKENILSLYIKTAKSKAIPLYVSLDIPDDLLIKKPRNKNNKYVVNELSTMDNSKVKVYRDGRVIVKKMKKESGGCKDAEHDKKIDLNDLLSDDDSEDKDKKSLLIIDEDIQESTKASRKKNKKRKKSADSIENTADTVLENAEDSNQDSIPDKAASPKKKKKGKMSAAVSEMESEKNQDSVVSKISPKKKKKGKKSILGQVCDETKMNGEEKTPNSHKTPSSRKKNRNSIYVEADQAIEDIQESIYSTSKKRKVQLREENINVETSLKTPSSSKKEGTEVPTASASFIINGKKPNRYSDINNSSVQLNKRRKSGRKSLSVL